MVEPSPRILVSAGEPSGDLHGAKVVRALRNRFPHCHIDAIGGPLIEEAGATLVCSIDELSVVGIMETLWRLPAHIKLYRRMKRALAAGNYDLVIPIDYPGFNLRLSQAARSSGVRVLYYIAPQLWAWRPGRARRFARAVDRMAVILPFEEKYFNEVGLVSTFVGHPLLDGDAWPSQEEARRLLDIPEGSRVLAVFPGSRRGEIESHWDMFRAAADRLLREGLCDRVLVAGTEQGSYPAPGSLEVVRGRPVALLAAADAAIAKSGTTTLQAAVADTPMVVAYKAGRLSFFVARQLVTVSWISLVNLIGENTIVPELIQDDLTVDRLVEELRPLLREDDPTRLRQLDGLAEVRRRLGPPGAAERLVALAAHLLGH